ncbi:threonyl-tRNA synthetase [Magnaporthiopsis poae ATCC 64411]|uniref:threonine--tRNA ligase n=1 Tax=Magnaporthiopsis poae (strain ATCC 64411 / 73-15) TaxID=644358 RepID=A0A0C4E3M0_MAGP6|nr:threonyl-tRNA synthetase [Magnaporthiopsis poae ATCC 64411]
MLPLIRASRRRILASTYPRYSCLRPIANTAPPSRIPLRFCASHVPTADQTPVPSTTEAPDHRTLGVRQELFTSSIYSPGSPIFLPNGTRIFNRLVEFLRRQYVRYGFEEVLTPTIYKKALWAKSGHLENYSDDMFTVTSTSPSRADSNALNARDPTAGSSGSEADEYGLKPMNCPGHCLIFASQRRSYRDLPIRYADFSPLHRNEISGALSGLTRVRRFHQDDGHIFCRPSQIEDEIRRTLEFVKETYAILKLGDYRLVLSTRPDDHFIGEIEEWDQAETALRQALDSLRQPWTLSPGDGAFYGPKIDIILRDSDGKEHQTATVQLDFQLPKRFDLEYQTPDDDAATTSGPSRPVLIHRAVLGSVERLMALLIEHYNGKYPFWLNPRQVMIITVNDTLPVVDRARAIKAQLLGQGGDQQKNETSPPQQLAGTTAAASQLAVDIDDSARSIGLKVREAKSKGYGAIITVGAQEVDSDVLPVDVSGMPNPLLPDGSSLAKPQGNRPLKLETAVLCQMLRHTVDSYE